MDMVFSEQELLGFDDEAVAQQSKQHWGKQTLLAAIHHFLTTAATFMFPLAFQSRKKVKAVFVFFPQWLPPPNTNKDILHMLAKTLFSFKVAAVLSKSPLLSKLPFFAAFCSFSLIQKRSDYQKKVRQRPLFKIVFFCFLILQNLKRNLDMVFSLIISFIHLGIPRRKIMINRFLNCLRPQEKKTQSPIDYYTMLYFDLPSKYFTRGTLARDQKLACLCKPRSARQQPQNYSQVVLVVR